MDIPDIVVKQMRLAHILFHHTIQIFCLQWDSETETVALEAADPRKHNVNLISTVWVSIRCVVELSVWRNINAETLLEQ